MSEEEDFDPHFHQNLSQNYGDPPELSITIPELSDLPQMTAPWKSVKIPTDVLLVTVKDCEFLGCVAFLKNICKSYNRGLGIVYFGDMGDVKDKVNVSLLRCSEGAAGPGAALSKVKTAISILQPKALFYVGFCGGLSYGKVKLGDVVISAKLTTYAHKKVMNDGEQHRGIITPVSRDFANLIKHAADGWKAPLANPEVNRKVEVHRDGVILSGPELVNSEWRREELLERYREAIAIEMEGEGVFAAANDLKMEWVVIKGISDYADGSKSKTQAWRPFASVMAASVVANILKVPGLLKDWQHYKGVNPKQEGFSKPGVMLSVSAFVVLLLAISLSINLKQDKPTNEFHNNDAKGPRTPNEDPVATLLQSITGGAPGQVNFRGRTIGYRALGRIHSLDEPWVYDATAWDIESGIKAKVKHYKESEEAIQDAVKEVITKLTAQGILQD
ncbi:death domain-containing ATP nucleosidase-like [Montipora capricornis]|uniref:death domain-containing ATP nucleosidase-like n=1 Tax=Montipora capricornis TaxID=246305 RepID=UPI0035F1D154